MPSRNIVYLYSFKLVEKTNFSEHYFWTTITFPLKKNIKIVILYCKTLSKS